MNQSITIVTAFFDIGRGEWQHNFPRSSQSYLSYFKNLATLENEMVIFTQKEFISTIREYRGNKPTHIIEIDFQDKYKNVINKVQNILDSPKYQSLIPEELLKNPEYSSAKYVVVTNLKFYFVKKAIEICNSEKDVNLYAWVDFGFCRKNSTTNGMVKWNHNFDPNYIHLFTLKESFIIEDKTTMLQKALNNEVYIAGGMFIGSKKCWKFLYPKITKIQLYYLNQNISDDDQGSILMTLFEYPNLFKVHYLKKGWFCGFKQFNKGSTYKNIFYKLKSLLKF